MHGGLNQWDGACTLVQVSGCHYTAAFLIYFYVNSSIVETPMVPPLLLPLQACPSALKVLRNPPFIY